MQSTTAFSGGFRYSPTTSRIFASSSGSVENLNVSRRHGCSFHLRQIRATEANEIPSSRGQQPGRPVRHPQTGRRAAPSASVATTTSISSISGGRPLRG